MPPPVSSKPICSTQVSFPGCSAMSAPPCRYPPRIHLARFLLFSQECVFPGSLSIVFLLIVAPNLSFADVDVHHPFHLIP